MSTDESNVTSESSYKRMIFISGLALVFVVGSLLVATLLEERPAYHIAWLASFGALSVTLGISARGRRNLRIFYIYVLRILWIVLLLLTLMITFG
jgi:hypothetical protein